MPTAARVRFIETDLSFFVESLIKGVAAVELKTVRGQYGIKDELFTGWEQFRLYYGGEKAGYEGVTMAKRALERGAILRVNKIGHFTAIGNPATLDAVRAAIDESGAIPDFAMDGADETFDLIVKEPGADYNNVHVYIEAASNGDADTFNLRFTHALEPDLDETYENIKIPGKPTIADSHFLDEVINKSKFFTVTYKNLSAAAGAAPIRPVNGDWAVTLGTDGSAVVDADYVGDAGAKNGFYAFGNFDDFEVLAPLDNFTNAVHIAGSAYAAGREDHIYIASIPKSNVTVATVTGFRGTTLIDSRFTYFVTGGLKIQNPFIVEGGGAPAEVSEIGDVIGIASRSSAEFGPWWSFAEKQRGLIYNALGIVNNFGPNYTDLNALALRQINAVVNKGGNIYLTGNYSGQLSSSRKSFTNVVRLIIFLKKSLRPTLERYLGQPLDFRTMKEIFNEANPFLDSLLGSEKRALVDYDWRGDQYANSDADLKYNTRAELDKGNYKVQLWLKEAVALNEILLTIISAPSGVKFEDNVN